MDNILTAQDLANIRAMLDEAIAQLVQATSNGLEDLQQQVGLIQSDLDSLRISVNYIKDTLDSVERVQQVEVQRADHHDLLFRKLRNAVKAA